MRSTRITDARLISPARDSGAAGVMSAAAKMGWGGSLLLIRLSPIFRIVPPCTAGAHGTCHITPVAFPLPPASRRPVLQRTTPSQFPYCHNISGYLRQGENRNPGAVITWSPRMIDSICTFLAFSPRSASGRAINGDPSWITSRTTPRPSVTLSISSSEGARRS